MISIRQGLTRRLFPLIFPLARQLGRKNDLLIPDGVKQIGGPETFRKNLHSGLEHLNYDVTGNIYGQYPLALVIQYFDALKLRSLKKAGVRIVLRLDGLAYEEWAGKDWEKMNEPVREVYADCADAVIFQSEYSARQADYFLGERHPRSFTIPNGASLKDFDPCLKKECSKPLRLVTTGNFRLPDMIVPQVEALRHLHRSGVDAELVMIGPVADPSLMWTTTEPGVRFLGAQSSSVIRQELLQADLFLFSMLNAACPNSVIEAIAGGLPVVGVASGALPELCSFNSDLLAAMPDRLIHQKTDVDPQALAEKVLVAQKSYEKYKSSALQYRDSVCLESMTRAYQKVLWPEGGR